MSRIRLFIALFASIPGLMVSSTVWSASGEQPPTIDQGISSFSRTMVRSNGETSIGPEGTIRTAFREDRGVYDVRCRLGNKKRLNEGVEITWRLTNWEDVDYFAFGWMQDGKFYHVKVKNPVQNRFATESVSLQSIAFGLSNNWEIPAKIETDEIRLFLKGVRRNDTASIELASVKYLEAGLMANSVFSFDGQQHSLDDFDSWYRQYIDRPRQPLDRRFRDTFRAYEVMNNSRYHSDAESFYSSSMVSLAAMSAIKWNFQNPEPLGIQEFTTTRFLWHALDQVKSLLLAFEETGEDKYLYTARELVSEWLSQHFFSLSNDQRFAWYDHGTALRFVVLVRMWDAGVTAKFDHRFMKRLLFAIVRHGELLSSEAFYARNQKTRNHNHALFQDISLMASRVFISELDLTEGWYDVGVKRIVEMFENLVTQEGVSVENSFGYHRATEEICRLITDLDSRVQERLGPTCDGMAEFLENIRYPDGRGPSFGDSFLALKSKLPGPACVPGMQPDIKFYEESGYGIVRDVYSEGCWQMVFVAPNLSATHKHADHLSLTLWSNEVEWIVDPGFYSHHYQEPINRFGRGHRGHNMPFIDGLEYSIEPGLAEISSDISDDGKNFTFRGSHRAYADFVLSRSITGRLGKRHLLVHDKVSVASGLDESSYRLQFYVQFGSGVKATLKNTSVDLHSSRSEASLTIHLPPEIDCRIDEGLEDGETIRGWVFPGFAQKLSAPALHCDLGSLDKFDWSIEIH